MDLDLSTANALDPNHGDLEATGRQAGTAAAAAAGLALATIAMITEFLIYSGFAPRVNMIILFQKEITCRKFIRILPLFLRLAF